MQTLSDQFAVPCVFMRGGTSKGPFFRREHLPEDPALRDRFLLRAMGASEPRRIDGLGGVDSLTNKVAIVSRSVRADADVDYLFAQICVHKNTIDYSVNCGNMLAAVGPFAVDEGLVHAEDGEHVVRIYNVNTAKLIHATVRVRGHRAQYTGEAAIDGVSGTAAPVWLEFRDVAGAKTGRLLPTGRVREVIDGFEVSCIDAAVPMVLARAADFGLSGHESAQAINADAALLARVERLRCAAGAAMGLGDVARLEMPKLTLVAAPAQGGSVAGRYFMPYTCHTAFAATGAVCLGAAAGTAGSLVREVLVGAADHLTIEHPSGRIAVSVRAAGGTEPGIAAVRLLRTARRLMAGEVYAPVEPSLLQS